MTKLLFGLALVPLTCLSVKAGDVFTYSGSTGGTWSAPANWTDLTSPVTSATGYPSTTSDTADDGITTGSQTVICDTGSSGSLGTLNLTNTGAGINELEVQRSLAITNAFTLGSGSGTDYLFLDSRSYSPNFVLGGTSATSGGVTINAGGVVEFENSSIATNNVTLQGPVMLSGGTINADVSSNAQSSQSIINGNFTMTSGTINLSALISDTSGSPTDYSGSNNTRLYFSGATNALIGGTITNPSVSGTAGGNASTASLWFNGGSGTNYIGGVTFSGANGTPLIELFNSVSSNFYSSETLAQVNFRGGTVSTQLVETIGAGTNVGTVVSASPTGTLNVSQLVWDSSNTNATAKLASNVTLNSNGFLPAVDGSLVANAENNAIDTNGHTLDLSQANTGSSDLYGIFTPDALGSSHGGSLLNGAGTGTFAFAIGDSGTGGVVKAPGFNLTGGYSGTSANQQSVTGDVVLQSTGGNATANNLGSPNSANLAVTNAISSSSTFLYSGAAAAGTPSTLVSNRVIGNLLVQNGALQVINGSALAATVPTLATAGNVAVTLNGTLDLSILPNAATGAVLSLTATGKTFTVNAGTLAFTLGNAYGYVQGTGTDTFSLTNLTLAITQGAGFSTGATYQVFQGFTAGTPDLGIATNVAGYTANIDALGNLTFTAVPEPSTWALMLGGLAGLAFLQRRRLRT
jgi:fibronectin-binding autotransporter adhesin